MTIEPARSVAHARPWGVADLHPWSQVETRGELIGEIWYERSTGEAAGSALQLKLLFTNQPLSIQVHPNDVQAQQAGFERGKSEAWYVLNAAPGAKVALGLNHPCGALELKAAAEDGSIVTLVNWQSVTAGDVVDVPAGTIHAIGSGLVIAEIQQRSDVTYRLFDHGRGRALHLAAALAVSTAGPGKTRTNARRISEQRQLLSCSSHFAFEKITVSSDDRWLLDAECETWIVVIEGRARIASQDLAPGDAIFAQSDHVDIEVMGAGVTFLVAYDSPSPSDHLLQRKERPRAKARDDLEPTARRLSAQRTPAVLHAGECL